MGATLEQLTWRRIKIKNSSEEKFRQEFPATPMEAFITSGANIFNTKGFFHQLVIGDGVQEVRVLGPLKFLKKVRGIRKVFIELSVCFCYTECVCFGRLPSICANRWVPGGRFYFFVVHQIPPLLFMDVSMILKDAHLLNRNIRK